MDEKQKVEVWLHGSPARSLEQIMWYLSGDAHDRSKVQIFVNTGDPKSSFFADFPFTEA
jgi:hypothetical protein